MRATDNLSEMLLNDRIPGIALSAEARHMLESHARMDCFDKPGTKVLFDAYGGYEIERESAKQTLELGKIYTVDRIEIGSCSSNVCLVEDPGRSWNTVLFASIERPE